MGIWERLGNVLKSYINDTDTTYRQRTGRGDPDYNAAYDELNDFLKKDKAETDGKARPAATDEPKSGSAFSGTGAPKQNAAPEELRPDFNELGVAFGASADECKEAYKKLMKLHHPDRHATHEGNFQKATAKSTRINAAYERITTWRNR